MINWHNVEDDLGKIMLGNDYSYQMDRLYAIKAYIKSLIEKKYKLIGIYNEGNISLPIYVERNE